MINLIQKFNFIGQLERVMLLNNCVLFVDLNRRLKLIEVVFELALFLYFDNFGKNPIYTLSEGREKKRGFFYFFSIEIQ